MCRVPDVKYPKDMYDVLWVFDQFAENSLSSLKMNVRDGGKQPVLRDTEFEDDNGNQQKQLMYTIVKGRKVPKGMKTVLTERGIDTSGMKAPNMVAALNAQPDFIEEKCILEQYMVFVQQRIRCEILSQVPC